MLEGYRQNELRKLPDGSVEVTLRGIQDGKRFQDSTTVSNKEDAKAFFEEAQERSINGAKRTKKA